MQITYLPPIITHACTFLFRPVKIQNVNSDSKTKLKFVFWNKIGMGHFVATLAGRKSKAECKRLTNPPPPTLPLPPRVLKRQKYLCDTNRFLLEQTRKVSLCDSPSTFWGISLMSTLINYFEFSH